MANLKDGLGGEEVNQETATGSVFAEVISGTNIFATTKLTTPAAVITNVSGTNVLNSQGLLKSVGIGSGTAVYGAQVRAGSGALSAGSLAWVLFPTAFAQVPSVTLSNRTTAAAMHVGSIAVGSFYVEGAAASEAFTWIAVGL